MTMALRLPAAGMALGTAAVPSLDGAVAVAGALNTIRRQLLNSKL